jgi:hypothetical protein
MGRREMPGCELGGRRLANSPQFRQHRRNAIGGLSRKKNASGTSMVAREKEIGSVVVH